MDIRKIKKLMELLEASDVAEIEVREGEESVRISRPYERPQPAPLAAEAVVAAGAGEQKDPVQEEGHVVRSPLVGVYYASPQPDQPPYAEQGQAVTQGDVLCIVEAMKVMNHIDAPASGTIVQIYAENGQPVEYDQPLFVIREA